MKDWLIYLLESGLCMAGIYAIYALWLRKLTHFGINRAFLLGGLGLAILLPLGECEVSWLANESTPATQAVRLPAELNLDDVPEFSPVRATVPLHESKVRAARMNPLVRVDNGSVTWPQVLFGAWLLGALLLGIRFGVRYWRLWRLAHPHPRGSIVLQTPGGGSFSFGGRIFLDADPLQPGERDLVLAHERAHLCAHHDRDNLLMELVRIIWWFHPLLPFWSRSLRNLHEFQADAAVAQGADRLGYSRLILRLAGRTSRPAPAPAFAASKAGQRIEMLHQPPSSPKSKLKYLALLPLLTLLLFSFVIVPVDRPIVEDGGPARPEFAGELIPVERPQVQARLESQIQQLKARPQQIEKAIARSRDWQSRIVPLLEEEGIPSDFFFLAVAESLLNNDAESSMGATGMWQFMPQTARSCGLTVNAQVDQRKDWAQATRAAGRFLRDLHRETGSWVATAVAYNKGLPGYRRLLQTHGAESYFDLPIKNESYLYRILAFKQLVQPELGARPAAQGTAYTNPPRIRPLRDHSGVEISSRFGRRKDPATGKMKMHLGIDLRAPQGMPVMAPADGEVIEAGEHRLWGKYIVLRHDARYTTRYCHLDDVIVTPGKFVKQKQVIGKVGSTGRSTGPHLHYEVYQDGTAVDPAQYWIGPEGQLFYRLPDFEADDC